MTSSRPFTAAMMLFWIVTLAMLALLCTWAPRGGIVVDGLKLFADSTLTDPLSYAMAGIGLSATAMHLVFAILAAGNVTSAGLLIFATMFLLLGQEQEQRECRPMVEGAAAVSAVTALVAMAISLAGGQAGLLMTLQLAALAGLALTVRMLAGVPLVADALAEDHIIGLDAIISRHAEGHAAFTAQLASITRKEPAQ